MTRLRKAFLGLLLVAAASAAIAGGVWWRWTRGALPQVDGELRLPGLSAPVSVRRDRLGVPHLEATSVPDVVRAQGCVAAQDRLWQMDLLRRRARGELSEVFGEAALPLDREMRTIGLGAAAHDALAQVPPDVAALLEAYAAGVNACSPPNGGAASQALPLEYHLLRYQPRPWTEEDTLCVGKLLAFDLARTWDWEAFRALVGDPLPADLQALFFPAVFPGDRILVGSDSPKPDTSHTVALAAETAVGSNNWVLSGAHTATGKPLLANDPHLGLQVPSVWMAVHLTAGDFDVAGVTLPGAPGVVLGRNRRLAWGCTNAIEDNADLYQEELDPKDPERYRTEAGWERAKIREEAIRIRTSPLASSWRTETLRVRVTRHGPLLKVLDHTYALRWTSLRGTQELTAFLLMDRASDWDEFREALRQFPGPGQNFVYADIEGHLAWYAAGRVPLRRSGDPSRPYPGASADGDWLGFIPFERLPHLVDPPSGRIVTANNRLVGTDYPYAYSRGGIGPWRAQAIFEALESREGWTSDDFVRLQAERLSIPHRDLQRALLAAATRHQGDPVWDEIAREMTGWDGRLQPESRAAALAASAFRAVGDRVLSPRLQGQAARAMPLRRRVAAVQRLVLDQPVSFVPQGDKDWDGVLRGSWTDALKALTAALGPDRARWRYGALNVMTVRHPLTRAVPWLAPLLNPPVSELGGGLATPNVLVVGDTTEGPSMRFVANLADPDDTRLVNFMGQSGHPASPHYADQFEAWARVSSRTLPFSRAAVARETLHELRLVP